MHVGFFSFSRGVPLRLDFINSKTLRPTHMPINFTCPHCGATSNVADQFAGTSGPCAKCGKPITIPGSVPAMTGAAPAKSNAAVIIIVVLVVAVVVLLMCGGMLAALLLPAVQSAREAARKSACMNNMKQISLAMMQYETDYGKFPPAYIADKNGRPMHSWRVLLLPYLEADDLYRQYDFNEPWDGPKNRQLAARMPQVYRCPSSADEGGVVTDYLVITGPGTMFDGDKGMSIAGVRDGLSNTILVVEVSGADIHWMEPRDLEKQKIDFSPNPLPGRSLHSAHHGGSNVGFADSHVQFLPDSTSPEVIRALITPAGDEATAPNF